MNYLILNQGLPDAPSGIRVIENSPIDGLRLQWFPPMFSGIPPVKQYIVAVKEEGKEKFRKIKIVPSDIQTCNIKDELEKGKRYVFRVYAENDVNYSHVEIIIS